MQTRRKLGKEPFRLAAGEKYKVWARFVHYLLA
jgi:hypothetical protein